MGQQAKPNPVHIAYMFYMCQIYTCKQCTRRVLIVYPDYQSGNIATLYLDTIGM